MIVDKTKGLSLLLPKLVLCYNAGSLVADESYCCDNFDDRVLPTLIELTSVLPNVGVIGRALKTYKEDVLSKKLLFFCLHATQLTLLRYAVKCWRKFQPRLHYLVYFQKGVFQSHFGVSRCVLPECQMYAAWWSIGRRTFLLWLV